MTPVVYNYDYLCLNAGLPSSFGSISSYGTIISFESSESGTTSASTYDVALDRCTPWIRGGIPELTFSRIVGALSSLISGAKLDPWDGYYVSWWNYETTVTPPTQPTPNYLAAAVYFTGTVVGYTDRYDHDFGWIRDYRALGLRNLADYVPVTDSDTRSDVAQFNMAANQINSIPSRMGRTCGQSVLDVLSMPQNVAGLRAYGIGNYNSTGSGATASATVQSTASGIASFGVVTGIAVTSGGSGYSSASPPRILIYGPCITQATASCTVTSGSVNGPITPSYGGTGYTNPPAVIISDLPTVTVNDLVNLTVNSPFPLTFCGERILQSVESIIQTCHPNMWLHVDPLGNIRILDQRAWTIPGTLASYTITLGNPSSTPEPDGTLGSRWMLPQLHRDLSDSYSQLTVRGDIDVSGIYLSVLPTATTGTFSYNPGDGTGSHNTGGLYPEFSFGGASTSTNAGAIAAWTPTSFVTQSLQGGQDQGQILSASTTPTGTPMSTTQCTIQSSISTENWPASGTAGCLDQTSFGLHAILTVFQSFGSGISQMFSTSVVTNAALSPGGTCLLTVSPPFPATTYTNYFLTFSSQAGNVVYRRYYVTVPGVGAALQNYFPYPFAYRNADGTAAALTSAATGMVLYSAGTNGAGAITGLNNGTAPYNESDFSITVDPESGTISFPRPTALVYGGGAKTEPSNVMAFVPVATGNLTLTVPTIGGTPTYQGGTPTYAGTLSSVEGVYRTKTITLRDWTQFGNNAANIQLFATEQFDSIKDVVVEGSINYLGLATTYLTPGASVSITGNGYMTGFETLQTSPMPPGLPVSSVEVIFNWGSQGTSYITTLNLSNRRQRYTGAIFTRPPTTGQALGGQFGSGYSEAWSEGFASLAGQSSDPSMGENIPGPGPAEEPPPFPEIISMPAHPGKDLDERGASH